MAARQLISALLAAAVVGLPACGGDDSPALSKETTQQMDARAAADAAKVDRMIENGTLPPVARHVLDLDGTLNVNFIDGPNGDDDVVHEGADGTSGKKLVWDLNRNGRIDPSERTITERELYDATLRAE
jgi:hypothetical protein